MNVLIDTNVLLSAALRDRLSGSVVLYVASRDDVRCSIICCRDQLFGGQTVGQVTFELPQRSLDALSLPNDELAAMVRMAAAMKLYELERISSGAAAELAGVPKPVFLSRLAEFGVETFRFTEQELLDEAPLG